LRNYNGLKIEIPRFTEIYNWQQSIYLKLFNIKFNILVICHLILERHTIMNLKKIGLVGILIGAFTFVAHAQMGQGGMMKGGMGRGCMANVNLTAEQIEKVNTLRQKFFDDNKTVFEARRSDMQKMMQSADFDEKAAKDLIAQRDAKRDEMQMQHLKFKHSFYQILTPEQRKIHDECQVNDQSWGKGMGHHKGKGMRGGW
jgi:Spy/CpxP family protein refolding chaperone